MNNTGFVNWPDSGHVDWEPGVGPGGMWVYAYVLADNAKGFVACSGPELTVGLPYPAEVYTEDPGLIYDPRAGRSRVPPVFPKGQAPSRRDIQVFESRMHEYYSNIYDAGKPILAAVCLGSTSHTWFSADKRDDLTHFVVTEKELTELGRALLTGMEQLYGTRPVLVTYLDDRIS